ncbi:putative Prion-inhibition and propagation HeLo domain-containing protein [Seiridium cardinale]|uniref:Prion-inhibition and propagation HeLo domain-containing protein n=1 Tax=Seiridium cardinale TaxID=138064 RepID=A0ABR2XRA2_9PEZI
MEALGLALGIAPLIIEILKSHPGPIQALQAARTENANEMLWEFYADLQFEVSMLRITLTELVNELPISPEIKEKLTDEKSLDPMVWKKPSEELQESLHRRLQPCVESFKLSMERILRRLAKLVDEKSIIPFLASDQVRVCAETPYAKLEMFFDAQLTTTKRLRLGWKKNERDIILAGITKHNTKLQKMLKRTAKARTSHIPIQTMCASESGIHPGLRQKMKSLRRSIDMSYCSCADKHELRFGLFRAMEDDDHVRMDMIMNIPNTHHNWHWAECKINIHLRNLLQSSATDTPPSDWPLQHYRRTSSSFGGTTVTENHGNDGSIELPQGVPQSILVSETAVNDEKTEKIQCSGCRIRLGPVYEKVLFNNICATVQRVQRDRRASQLVFCQNRLWRNRTSTDTEVICSEPGVSLDRYLQKGSMTMRERKILQVLLAQSVLYFPWTGQSLNKSSITFHQALDKPFATLLLNGNDTSSPETSSSLKSGSKTFEFKPYCNEMLAGLATTLLELELEKRIEELRIDNDTEEGDSSEFDANFWTLTRVLKEQEFNMYKECYQAIDACIRQDFVDGPPMLDNPKFLQRVYERIVAPLELELWHGFSYRIPHAEITGQGMKALQ